jgi:anti-sigma B factor antagonist
MPEKSGTWLIHTNKQKEHTMRFEERQEQGVLVIRPLERRLDAAVTQEFKQYMSEKVQAGNRLIALDLGEIDFIDSSGLGGIISVLKVVGGSGNIAIFGADPNVQRLFRLTRMDRIFQMLDGVEEAMQVLAT